MPSAKNYLFYILIFFISFVIPSFSAEIKLLNSSENEIIFSISEINFKFDYVTISDKNYKKIIIPGELSIGNPGEPELPVISRQFGVPYNKIASVEVIETDFFTVENEDISPAPEIEGFDNIGEFKYNYSFDKQVYSSDRYFPETIAEITDEGFIRMQKVCAIQIHPLQYNPQQKELKVYRYIRLLIKFSEDSRLEKIPKRDEISIKYFKDTFKNLINYDDVIKWNSKGSSVIEKKVKPDDVYSFEDFKYKIEAEEDGLYKLSYDYLISTGINISEIDPRTIKIFNREDEIPIYVSGEADGKFDKLDYIIFYGTRKRGITEFFDPYTDRNVYWLGWDGEEGKRFEDYDGSLKDGNEANFFIEKQHNELDVLYSGGDTDEQIRITDKVQGEGWYWTSFEAGRSRSFNIYVNGLTNEGDNPKLRLKFRGVTLESHHLKMKINDTDVGDIVFDGRGDTIPEFNLDKGIIKEGENVFAITNVIPAGKIDMVYMDWIEIDYSRRYSVFNNMIKFSSPKNNGTRYLLDGFGSDDVEIIDITEQKRITNFQVEPVGKLFNVTFEDTLAVDERVYFAVCRDGFLLPADIKKFSFADLKNPSNSVDYLIITHEKFKEFANLLSEYRKNKNSFQTMVVDVENIYNEFNYGIASPYAVKDFLKFAYNNWTVVPSFLVMFGDASWDYKKKGSASKYENYVPSYGFPASDNWFVSLDSLDGEEDILPDMYLGRIPVATEEQAEKYIQKIIDYESYEFNLWNKRILIINGGIDSYEQGLFQASSNYIVNEVTSPPPSGMENIVINKTTTDLIDFTHRDEIINIIDEGVLWVNSAGHAAPQTYDVDFGRPSDLNNYKKYPFMVSMSCNTGKFANPSVFSLGEDYLLIGDKGAIEYFGTTGWGYIQLDEVIQEWLFTRVFIDSVRMFGIFATDAKINLWGKMGKKYKQEAINLVNQYTLLGDPCVGLALPDKPELVVKTDNIIFSNDFPNEMDFQITIDIKIDNFGLFTSDIVKVSIYDEYEGEGIFPIKENIEVEPIGTQDTISVNWEIYQKEGKHRIIVRVDPENIIDEVNEENNTAERDITVFSSGVTLLKPPNFSRVNTEEVKLEAFCHSQEVSPIRTLEFEADTSENFHLPFYTSGPIPEKLVTTDVTVNLPYDKTIYYWRVRSFDGLNYSRWGESVFYSDFESDSGFVWIQNGKMFEENLVDNLKIDGDIVLAPRDILLRSESAGFSDGDYAMLYVDKDVITVAEYDTTLLPIRFYNQGFYTAVIDEKTGQLQKAVHFNTHRFSEHSDAMADFIDSAEENRIVMCGVVSDGSSNLTNSAKDALKSIGSMLIDNLGFQDSYAIIGRRGAVPGSVPEQHKKAGTGRAVAEDSISTLFLNGSITSKIIDGAKGWKFLSSVADVPGDGTELVLNVIAFNKKMFTWDTIYKDISSNVEFDLSGINPNDYPKLKLNAQFSDDDGLDTPYLSGWTLSYEPACDLSTNFKLVSIDKDSLLEGESVNIYADIYNIGFSPADSIVVRFFAVTEKGRFKFRDDLVLDNILQNEFKSANTEFNTSGYKGNIKILVEVDPDNIINELSDFNNSGLISLSIMEDKEAPSIEVTFDGVTSIDGDYISQNPEILIRIKDNNPSGIKDTSNVEIYLDNKKISFYNNPIIKFISQPTGGDISAEVIYTPSLEDGEHKFKVIVTDVGQNSSFYEVGFKVSSHLEITKVYNFPNPIDKDTYFTYVLTKEAEEVSIRLFTISGRLIKVLSNAPSKAGYNQIYWDGKDEDGDNLANGVYFYKIIAKSGDENFSFLEKFVIMR